MSGTVRIKFSDAELKRQLRGSADELRDNRFPGLAFRVIRNRTAGSWYFVFKKKWEKVGNWPQLSATAVVNAYPSFHDRLAKGASVAIGQSGWSTVAEVLTWYRDRSAKDRQLSQKRRNDIKTVIDRHLFPRIGSLKLGEITHSAIDQQLIWPLQEELALSSVRLILQVMGSAFKKALKLKMLESNPVAGMTFSEFVDKGAIKPKAAQLHSKDLSELVPTLASTFEKKPLLGMLALMMLAHGTRIGETRQARWVDFSLSEQVWVIPASTTKTAVQHVLPLTKQVCALLQRYRAILPPGQTCLFPAKRGKGPIGERVASRLFSELDTESWSSHDLRKLARSGWADLGVDHLIGELLLNHAMGYSAKTYINTSGRDLKRNALERWHSQLDGHGFFIAHGLTGVRLSVSDNAAQTVPDAAHSDFSPLSPKKRTNDENGPKKPEKAPTADTPPAFSDGAPTTANAASLACARVSLPIEQRIDWTRMIFALCRMDMSLQALADAIGSSRTTVMGWRNGAHPRYEEGERLIAYWCMATGRDRQHVPTVSPGDWRSNHAPR